MPRFDGGWDERTCGPSYYAALRTDSGSHGSFGKQHKMLRVPAYQNHVRREGRLSQRSVNRHMQRLCPVWNGFYFLLAQIAYVNHLANGGFQFLRLLRGQRSPMCVCSDGAVQVIFLGGVEHLSFTCLLPEGAACRAWCFHPIDALWQRI